MAAGATAVGKGSTIKITAEERAIKASAGDDSQEYDSIGYDQAGPRIDWTVREDHAHLLRWTIICAIKEVCRWSEERTVHPSGQVLRADGREVAYLTRWRPRPIGVESDKGHQRKEDAINWTCSTTPVEVTTDEGGVYQEATAKCP